MRTFLSTDPDATFALAAALGRAVAPGTLITLDGELGSGKTLFVRGLGAGLDVDDDVASPTYTLLHEYRGRLTLYHFDAWLEGRERAFLLDGGAEWMDASGVAVIEWAERVVDLLPTPRIAVRFEHRGPDERRLALEVVGEGPALEAVVAGLPLPASGLEEIPEGRGEPGPAPGVRERG